MWAVSSKGFSGNWNRLEATALELPGIELAVAFERAGLVRSKVKCFDDAKLMLQAVSTSKRGNALADLSCIFRTSDRG